MMFDLFIQYIILFYGIGTPFFYAIYKFTIFLAERRDRKRGIYQQDINNSPQAKTSLIRIPEVEKFNKIKAICENDNINANDRITLMKLEIKKKK